MECELNKPLCKRKAMAQSGAFQPKQSCPLSQTPACPLAQPKCPLLPQEEEGGDCPITKIVGGANGKVCPLAQQGCPCDPCPPCPLAYDTDEDADLDEVAEAPKANGQKQGDTCPPCPSSFPAFGKCPKTVGKSDTMTKKSPCPNVYSGEGQEMEEKKTGDNISLDDAASKPYTPGAPLPELLKNIEELKSQVEAAPQSMKKGLTVPDCTLASRRPLPCSKCLGDLLSTPNLKISPKDCPYLKLVDMCEGTCLCEDVPAIDAGPPCPFAPKPCPCCAFPRCPLSRQPDCPLVSREPKMKTKPPPCKCYCPVIPPSCVSGVPPMCKMHNNIKPAPCPLNPPKCKCSCTCACKCSCEEPPKCPLAPSPPKCKCECKCSCEEPPKCPLVPNSFAECPLQPAYQSVPCADLKPCPPPPPPPKKSKLPNLLVPPNVLTNIESTLEELNKICTCDEPPAPQMVNMIPTTSIPSRSKPLPTCIASGDHDKCPLECPCEPPRTFHVPTCPKKNPACLKSPPKSKNKGDMVCPFSPRCCPLGRVCPFPVAAVEGSSSKIETKIEAKQTGSTGDSKIQDSDILPGWCKERDGTPQRAPPSTRVNMLVNQIQNDLGTSNLKGEPGGTKTDVANQFQRSSFSKTQNERRESCNDVPPSNCPLSNIPSGSGAKKKTCPFAPAPCPLDPIKPLPIKEPKPCPFAPEPACPLMPKPLCPATPRCLIKPLPPLPECPYAPPSCPLAPKKVCFQEGVNYDCPCPKPQPCPCSDPCCPCPKTCCCPDPKPSCCPPPPACPCPDPKPSCCPPPPGCPCPDPDPCCPCPDPDPCCPCPDPSPGGCPDPNSSGCPCPPQDGACCPCPMLSATKSCPCPDPNPGGCPCPNPNSRGCPSPDSKQGGCPDPNQGCCPEPNQGCPEPNQGGCPEPNQGGCPEPKKGCPEPNRGCCPDPNQGCCPDPNQGCCPKPNQGGCPEPNRGCCPDPNQGCCPDPNQGCCPEPNQGGCPDPNRGCCPEPNQGGCPDPNQGGCPEPNRGCCPDPNQGCCPDPNQGCCPDPNQGCCPEPNPGNFGSSYPKSGGCPSSDPTPGCACPDPNQEGCTCPDPEPCCPCPPECPLTPKPLCPLVPQIDRNCPLAAEKANTYSFQNKDTCPLASSKSNGSGDNGCSCSDNATGCCCPPQDGACCPCPMLSAQSACQCGQSAQSGCVINKVIKKLKKKKKDLDCAVKTPPCEKFPEGRCPMQDLGLCDCPYPCPPCMEPPQCGAAQAPPQFCAKLDCCMGLGLPPVIPDDRKFLEGDKPLTYYKFVPSKPGKEETKYYVEMLDHPPNEFPFGEPKDRTNPNWYIVRYGAAYEQCKTVAEKLKDRAPSADAGVQFDRNDNPMDPEMKHLIENMKYQAKMDKLAENPWVGD